jgi:very-short-patch-repair endonuclease
LSFFRGKRTIRGDSTSNAEVEVFAELQRRGLNFGMASQVTHIFDVEVDGVHATVTDFEWAEKKLCVFLDGDKVHGKVRQGRKDVLVDGALYRRGMMGLRFEYRAPIARRRVKEIVDEIEKELKK